MLDALDAAQTELEAAKAALIDLSHPTTSTDPAFHKAVSRLARAMSEMDSLNNAVEEEYQYYRDQEYLNGY
jgi:ABC-type transporter Mla subunit MlaD